MPHESGEESPAVGDDATAGNGPVPEGGAEPAAAEPGLDDTSELFRPEALAPAPPPPDPSPEFGVRHMWADPSRDYTAGPLPLEHEGLTRHIETGVLTGARWVDRFQAKFPPVGFAYATFKKYADDEGSRLAALMAYYTFLSLFPLAIGFVAVLNRLLVDYPQVVQQVIEEVVPVQYQQQILDAYSALPQSGPALIIAMIGLLLAGTGGAFAFYATINQIFCVPYRYRYGYGPRYARVIVVIFIMAFGVIVATIGGTYVGAWFDAAAVNRAAVVLLVVVVCSWCIFVGARILSRRVLHARELLLGSVLGAIIVTSVVSIGSALVSRLVAGSSPVYGAFATVVAIISVLLIGTNGIVIALEISVVRAWQLWPRGVDIHLLFPADERAYTLLTLMDERMPSQRNDVRFDADGHFDSRRPAFETLDRRQPGIPRTPYHRD